MGAQPGPGAAPALGVALGVVEVHESLTTNMEERTKGTTRSTRGLSVGVRTRAGSVTKPRAWAYSMKARFSRGLRGSAASTIADMLSGMTTAKTPPKNDRGLAAGDHCFGGLAQAQPHEAVPAVDGGEDQRPHHPVLAGGRIRDEPHLAEVDL